MNDNNLRCINCDTSITPLWRKRNDGTYQCNACGLYKKIHGIERPKTMKSNIVRQRKRIRKNKINWLGKSEEENNENFNGMTDSKLIINDIIDNQKVRKERKRRIGKEKKGILKISKSNILDKICNLQSVEKERSFVCRKCGSAEAEEYKAYDDTFDYNIVTETKKSLSGLEEVKTLDYLSNLVGDIIELSVKDTIEILKDCTSMERVAVEGLLKLSKSQ